MTSFRKRSWLAVGFVALMAAVLAALAVLQYRSIGEVSRAERMRMRASLVAAIERFRTEFNSEVMQICAQLQPEPRPFDEDARNGIAEQYYAWQTESAHARLLSDLYLWTPLDGKEGDLLRLDADQGEWRRTKWPAVPEGVRTQIALVRSGETFELPYSGLNRRPSWRVFPEVPALARAIVLEHGRSSGPDRAVVLLWLDPVYLRTEFLPELARRSFGPREETSFDVAVLLSGQKTPVFQTAVPASGDWLAGPDARVPLLWSRAELVALLAARQLDGMPLAADVLEDPVLAREAGNLFPFTGRLEDAMDMALDDGGNWELLARYREGPLEALVEKSRMRSLAVSFGVLLLLAAGLAVLVLASRRAERFARMQMRFVAGVSHDLRTPLAVICSAADNLAEGSIEGTGPRVREYGSVIRNEGRKLSSMIEQILEFAGLQGRTRRASGEPLSASEAVGSALAQTRSLLESAGVAPEIDIPLGLPQVIAEPRLLSQLIQNLASNVAKHGASGGWLGVRARSARLRGKPAVEIRFEDRGPGIDPADLPHVFEPFYRGRIAAGTPGSGLGLSLAAEAVEAMGGRIRAANRPEGGAVMTVTLPAATGTEKQGATNGA